jgi:hypothetical protein
MYTRGLIDYQFVQENGKTERRILFTKLGIRYGCEELALLPSYSSETRKREVLKVYLDMANDDHKEAYTIARSLAGERILTPTIVDLLIMHSEFLSGDDTTLHEAYPGIHKLLTETKEQKLFDRLEELIQNAPQPVAPQPQSTGVGLKGLSGGGLQPIKLAAPSFDDDEDMPELTITKAKPDGQATQNFLNSLNNLQNSL